MQAAGRRRDIALLAILHRQQAGDMPFVLRPRPTLASAPAMLRIMWWRKALPWISITTSGP